MKAKFKSKIKQMVREEDGTVNIDLATYGKVNDDTVPISAKDCGLTLRLNLKSFVADRLKIGSILVISIEDDEEVLESLK